ncbi:DDB1- and CUL4-associated factor 8-like [Amphibalanus amphitrite]|uniref:DDB1- and CUL4-associated factor 8-like n=1 Tax=Amphibalanus amphitrite TaxID=1232801 RepID=UPI001C8FC0AF|nr:DDB1- and CUL4-associated factor 8-like [Amphibalanus amphitrite]XP_043201033.1 DDB1- and CUL4-associated factor 8-like [Amphibalanus amphitrite]XP_043201034.1 DDB1- and CUL4-associated factor 8-like [Amphibalanus amphitrite]XP_043201036.1 DDB1- and CUL4-associated factor 8-like [Amphibalanus amphitrite]
MSSDASKETTEERAVMSDTPAGDSGGAAATPEPARSEAGSDRDSDDATRARRGSGEPAAPGDADSSRAEADEPPTSPPADGSPSEPMEAAGSEGARESTPPVGDGETASNEDDDDDIGLGFEARLSSSSPDSDSEMEYDEAALSAALADMKKKAEDVMQKPRPRHTWSLVRELHKRQLGGRPALLQQDRFRLHLCSSLHAVERLELMDKLCFHEGCVNCLHFNSSGDLLASGSDDLNVVVWDWQRQRKAYSYNSGHKSNIFESKFVPQRSDTHIVSTSRDGQVRLAEISPAGECRSVRRLAQHRGSGRKLALPAHSPQTVLSCGEDAVVFNIDLRDRQPDRLLECMDNGKRIPTNSIACHPDNDNVFLLACIDKYVRVYDRRMIGSEQSAYRRLCPHRLLDDGRGRYSVTCAVFSYNGAEIVASYNDDDVYLFDAAHSDGADCVHQYSGHRNSATIKGVNFYGPRSEYIVSGSDCGNIFFWDKNTEAIVQCMPGDEKGVVNCLEPHPHMPVLATSGLDDDVKLWIASRDQPQDLSWVQETVQRNLQERVEETPSADSLGGSLMWTLMQQVFGAQRRARHQLFSNELDLQSSDESDDADDGPTPGDCRTS